MKNEKLLKDLKILNSSIRQQTVIINKTFKESNIELKVKKLNESFAIVNKLSKVMKILSDKLT